MSIDTKTICIVIAEEEGHVIFSWNLTKNCENTLYDVGDYFKINWDNQGAMYILDEEGNIFFTELLCKIKAF